MLTGTLVGHEDRRRTAQRAWERLLSRGVTGFTDRAGRRWELASYVEMATRAVTAPTDGTRPRPLVSVLVDYQTFTQRVCELADGTVITPGTLATQLDEALIERVIFDGPSRIIDLGQARSFTGAARRALEIRDRCCGHEGCHTPGHRCQGDHIHRHADGGPANHPGRLLL